MLEKLSIVAESHEMRVNSISHDIFDIIGNIDKLTLHDIALYCVDLFVEDDKSTFIVNYNDKRLDIDGFNYSFRVYRKKNGTICLSIHSELYFILEYCAFDKRITVTTTSHRSWMSVSVNEMERIRSALFDFQGNFKTIIEVMEEIIIKTHEVFCNYDSHLYENNEQYKGEH